MINGTHSEAHRPRRGHNETYGFPIEENPEATDLELAERMTELEKAIDVSRQVAQRHAQKLTNHDKALKEVMSQTATLSVSGVETEEKLEALRESVAAEFADIRAQLRKKGQTTHTRRRSNLREVLKINGDAFLYKVVNCCLVPTLDPEEKWMTASDLHAELVRFCAEFQCSPCTRTYVHGALKNATANGLCERKSGRPDKFSVRLLPGWEDILRAQLGLPPTDQT